MSGAKDRSGGKRDGAGRKPASFTVRLGDKIALVDGEYSGIELGTIITIERTKFVIRLKDRDITIVR